MSRIRGRDTKPELLVRSMLHKMGYRFRLNVKIPIQLGTQEIRKTRKSDVRVQRSDIRRPASAIRPLVVRPDIVLPKYKTAIFVHGC
jgi:DNA mismatch endonuclease (patch repair protein)